MRRAVGIDSKGRRERADFVARFFRVHEMNVEGVLACFFPYHDSPQFVRILSILRIP